MVGAERHNVREFVDDDRHVEVYIGDHLLVRNRGVAREMLGTQQALFLTRQGDEQDRATRGAMLLEGPRRFQHHGDTRRIVDSTVTDGVFIVVGATGATRPHVVGDLTDVIEVRRQDDILISDFRVRATDHADNIRISEGLGIRTLADGGFTGQVETREGCTFLGGHGTANFLEAHFCTFKQLCAERGADRRGCADLLQRARAGRRGETHLRT